MWYLIVSIPDLCTLTYLVLKIDPQSHIGQNVFKAVGWLSVSKSVDQIILNRVFKINLGTSPDYMIEHFVPASSVHSVLGFNFRDLEDGNLSLPKVKSFGKKSCLSGMYFME